MPWDKGKTIGVKTYEHVLVKDRNKYKKDEEAAQNKSKKSWVESKSQTSSSQIMFNGQSPSPHACGFSPVHSRHRTISNFLDKGCRDDMDAKDFRFLYACGVPFNVLCSPHWHEMLQAINGSPKGYKSPGYDKARTMGLDKKRAKIHSVLGQFTNDSNKYRYTLYLMVGQMLNIGY
jgi:hypothetical protein